MFKAINTFAIPALTYSFGVIRWTQTDLHQLQTKINTTLTKHRCHHPKSAIQRLVLPRKDGGRGLIDITTLHNSITHKLRTYFYTKQDTSELHKAVTLADNDYTPLNLHDTQINLDTQTDTNMIWRQKALHGRYPNEIDQPHVDKEASHAWLTTSGLYPETEGFMIAIQDQVIYTKNYRKYITKDTTMQNDMCRKCHHASETIQHIISSCPLITQTDYKHRHDQVGKIIHQKLAHQHNLITTTVPYYKYTPEIILESTSHKIYWDRAIITDKTIHHNRPDITLIDKTNKTTYLIDIAVPNTHNLQKTQTEKISKYTELAMEVKALWRMDKVVIVPIVLSATGIIPKALHPSLHTIQLPHYTYIELQKAVILNTCRTVRMFLGEDTTQDNT